MRMGQTPKALSALIATLLVAACGPILELPGGGEAPRLFRLNPSSDLASFAATVDATILVEQPTVPGGLSSDYIAVRSGEHEIEYLAGARWSDRAGELIARYFVESLQGSGAIRAIGVESLDLPNDFRLKINVQEFAAIAGEGAPISSVEFRFSATIVNSMPVSIVATKTFSSLVNIRRQDPADIVAALNEAADSVMGEMFGWLLTVINGTE